MKQRWITTTVLVSFFSGALVFAQTPAGNTSSDVHWNQLVGPEGPVGRESGREKTAGEAVFSENVRYKAGKDVDLEQLVIQGQLKRPDLIVVTGNEASGTQGLLKLRESFLDRTAADIGESSEESGAAP